VKKLENGDKSYESKEVSEATVDESGANQISVTSIQHLAGSPTKSHMVKEVVYKEQFLNKHWHPEHNSADSAFTQWVAMTKEKQHTDDGASLCFFQSLLPETKRLMEKEETSN
jgi:hypothetical protein